MDSKWLLVGLIVLMIGATLSGLAYFSYQDNQIVMEKIGTQSGSNIVHFYPSFNYTHLIQIDINGNYSTNEQTVWLRIVNQTGSLEYYQPIDSFPIENIGLFNSTGQYTANFEGLIVPSSTSITVNMSVQINGTAYPYSILIIFGPIIFVCGILIFFLSYEYKLKRQIRVVKNNPFTMAKKACIVIVAVYALTFSACAYLLAMMMSAGVSIIYPNYTLIELYVNVSIAVIAYVGYIVNARYSITIDILESHKQLAFIKSIDKSVRIGILLLFPTFITIVFYTPLVPLFIIPLFSLVLIFAWLLPIDYLLTEQGAILLRLLNFLDDYKKNGLQANFSPIRIASTAIIDLVHPFNLTLSSYALSASLSFRLLCYKCTEDLNKLIEIMKETPFEYGKLLLYLEVVIKHGTSLQGRGITTHPSFTDRISKYFVYIVPLVTAAVTIMKLII